MSTTIYLDNSATTPLCPEALTAMMQAMGHYGNPSSLHSLGQEAHTILNRARNQVGSALGVKVVRPGELVFTSCGTEASALAIYGTVYAKPRRFASRIISTEGCSQSVVMMRLPKRRDLAYTVP